jgi:hypothetical protein
MPPAITVGLLILLISFVIITRGVIYNNNEKNSVPVLSGRHVIAADSKLNNSEHTVLAMLYSTLNLSDQLWRENNTSVTLYYKTLLHYFCESGVNLSSEKVDSIGENITSLQKVINEEKKTDFMQMSLDARKVVIYILQQIYEVCGLTMESNLEGNTQKIYDESGTVLYNDSSMESIPKFQGYAMCITMLSLFALFGILMIISKKNQLFGKEDVYNGFDEERFA